MHACVPTCTCSFPLHRGEDLRCAILIPSMFKDIHWKGKVVSSFGVLFRLTWLMDLSWIIACPQSLKNAILDKIKYLPKEESLSQFDRNFWLFHAVERIGLHVGWPKMGLQCQECSLLREPTELKLTSLSACFSCLPKSYRMGYPIYFVSLTFSKGFI